jgi:hypothetical protein
MVAQFFDGRDDFHEPALIKRGALSRNLFGWE